jgi:hypothetical protein
MSRPLRVSYSEFAVTTVEAPLDGMSVAVSVLARSLLLFLFCKENEEHYDDYSSLGVRSGNMVDLYRHLRGKSSFLLQ